MLRRFRKGSISILIATDVAARGLDVPGLKRVLNFDFPIMSVNEYVHRIGRTGRAGASGSADTIFTRTDAKHAASLAAVLRASGQHVPEALERLQSEESVPLTRRSQKRKRKREGDDPTPELVGVAALPTEEEEEAPLETVEVGDGRGEGRAGKLCPGEEGALGSRISSLQQQPLQQQPVQKQLVKQQPVNLREIEAAASGGDERASELASGPASGPSPHAEARSEAAERAEPGARRAVPEHMLPTVLAPPPEIEPPAHLSTKERRKWYKAQRVPLDAPVRSEKKRAGVEV